MNNDDGPIFLIVWSGKTLLNYPNSDGTELDIRSIKSNLNPGHVPGNSPKMVQRKLWTTMLPQEIYQNVTLSLNQTANQCFIRPPATAESRNIC